MMVSGSLAQWKGFGSVLASATKRLMASWSETREWKSPRFRRRLVSLAKKLESMANLYAKKGRISAIECRRLPTEFVEVLMLLRIFGSWPRLQ
jgi:hypothetical protein